MQKIGDIPNTRADSNGEFTDGNVAGGVPPTILPAEWFNTIQRELMSVLSAAEIDADSTQFNQVLLSIQKMIGEGIPDIKDASLTQKGIVQLSNATNSTSEKTAATPKAVSDLGKLLLKITNNLSEIKDAGPEAVAQTLLNLGLDDVIRKSDTNVQLPGQLTTKGDIKSTGGDLYSGDARFFHDGDILGSIWGDSLFHYLDGKLPKVTTVYINAGTPESPYQYPVRSRQTFGNPFPGRIIECKAELFINNIWGPTGFIYSSDNSWGVTASPFDNSARIVVQSGRTGTAAISENSGGVHGISYNVNAPLPIRLKVWTVD